MRALFFLPLVLLAAPTADAQFVASGETDDVRYWGFHLNSNILPAPLDRFTGIEYDEGGARVVMFETALPTLLYGIVALIASGDTDAEGSTADRFVPLVFDATMGRTFVATPVGEAGVGIDYGIGALTASEGSSDLDLAVYAGPNVLFTARPVENLHLVGHASYNWVYSAGSATTPNGWGNRILEADVQATWPLNDSFAVYGGVGGRSWTFGDASFSAPNVSLGVKVSSKYLFVL